MQRLLIIGCGDVLRRALPLLRSHFRLYALVRRDDPALREQGVTLLRGDLDAPATLRRIAGIAQVVVHSAPPPSSGDIDPRTRRLITALRRRTPPSRLVYLGTSGVYGDCQGAQVTETRPICPTTARARRRQDAENCLRAWGRPGKATHHPMCRVSLLRIPGIYAADRLPFTRQRPAQPVLAASEDVYSNHIHADDLATITFCALWRGRANRTYNACDNLALRVGDWYDALADAQGLPRPPRLPRAALAATRSTASLEFLSASRQLDNQRLKRELRVTLRYPTVYAFLSTFTEGSPHALA